MAKVDASEEIQERVLLSLVKGKFINLFHHLLD